KLFIISDLQLIPETVSRDIARVRPLPRQNLTLCVTCDRHNPSFPPAKPTPLEQILLLIKSPAAGRFWESSRHRAHRLLGRIFRAFAARIFFAPLLLRSRFFPMHEQVIP